MNCYFPIPAFFLFLGLVMFSAQPLADVYYEPGINPYREQVGQDGVTSVDPYMGMLKVRHLDLLIPGNGGLDIKVMRTYDSSRVVQFGVGGGQTSPIGNGWSLHFGYMTGYKVCQPGTSGWTPPTIQLPDGAEFRLAKGPLGFAHLYTSRDGWAADCANVTTGEGLIVYSPEGMKYEMTVKGVLGAVVGANIYYVKKITDRHGNWLSFDYQVTNNKAYVLKLTANDGRVVDFSYAPGTTTGERLAAIKAGGRSWTFDYALSGTPLSPANKTQAFELAKVTRPDGSIWRYEYPTFPSNSPFVTAKGYLGEILTPQGGREQYTYSYVPSGVSLKVDMLRATKKVVLDNMNAASTWAYRYKFWESVGGSSIGVSTTDVTDPTGGLTTYKFETPYNSSTASAWRIGLQLDKLECSSKNGTVLTCDPLLAKNRVQNEWGSQEISPDVFWGSTGIQTYYDSRTYRPLLTKQTVTRDGTAYVTQYQNHDTFGNPSRIVETGNGTTRTTDLTYFNDPVKWITGLRDKETVAGSWVVDRTFDAKGNILSVSKYGVPTNYTYHASGDLASSTDAKSNRTDYLDYYRGVPRREDQPEGVTVFRTVNVTGTLASETDGEGRQTQYTYDGLNRLAGIAPPLGNPISVQWSGLVDPTTWPYNAVFTKKVTRGHFEETTKFDGFGRVVDVVKLDTVSQAKVRRAYRYDAVGRKTMEAYPTTSLSGQSLPGIDFGYDEIGRLLTVKHADGKTRQLQYLTGNQVKVTNEGGKLTTYSYRSYGDPEARELMGVSAPVAAANMMIARNELGQITSLAQSGVTRTMQYDTRGYLVKVTHPEIGAVTYGRDAVGNPSFKSVGVSPNVRTINFAYDGRNRLIGTTYPDTTTPAVSLGYNRVDDVISATRGAIARSYDYDANRNLIAESLTTDGRTFSLAYIYDDNDATTQVIYPDLHVVNYYPDALGQPSSVSPYVTSIAYHPSGQVSGMTFANGVTVSQAFNTRQWPSQMSVVKSATGLLNTAYSYDGLGNVTSISDSVDTSLNRSLGYDDIDRLTSVTGPWGAGSINYDGRGNLLSQNYGAPYSRTYTYDAANRLASYTGSSAFTYDAWGNATRSGNALSYHLFDDASNLYCASCDTANPLLFEYDANNYRVKKTRNGVVTYSLYAKDGNLMMEYTPSAGDLKQFAYHNKKQVAMRHVVDPAMILGENGMLYPTRFVAAAIPLRPVEIEISVLSGLIPPTPLLSFALVARAE